MNQAVRPSRLGPLVLALGIVLVPVALCAEPAICGLALVALLILLGWCGVAVGAQRWVLPLLALQLVVLCLVRLGGLWPCDVACQGGHYYQTLLGVPVTCLALAADLLLALLAIRDARRGRWSPALGRIAYALAGASVFYLWIAAQLGMECRFCRAMHLTTLLTLACVMPPRVRLTWASAATWLCGGFLALNLAYHHRVVADVADPGQAASTATGSAPLAEEAAMRASPAYQAMASGRRHGSASLRYQVVVVVDPHCSVCAEEYGPLRTLLLPLAGGPTPALACETMILTRPSDRSGIDLARHLIAAASLGSERFDATLAVMLGAPERLDFAGMRSRLAEVDDPGPIEAALAHAERAVELLLHDDAVRLTVLDGGSISPVTPQVLLIERTGAGGERVLRHWQGRLQVEDLGRELRALVAP